MRTFMILSSNASFELFVLNHNCALTCTVILRISSFFFFLGHNVHQGRFIKGSTSWELWAGPLSDGCAAAVLVNLGLGSLTHEIAWGDIGLHNSAPMRVVDVYVL